VKPCVDLRSSGTLKLFGWGALTGSHAAQWRLASALGSHCIEPRCTSRRLRAPVMRLACPGMGFSVSASCEQRETISA